MIAGVLGGTFDPPHLGHLQVATTVLGAGLVDEVWMVPCLTHRFGKAPVPFHHRVAMCEQLAGEDPRIKVSEIEAELNRPGYTLDLVELLMARHPDTAFRLIAGTDIYHERNKWHRYDDVAELAPPIYVERRGQPPIPGPTLAAPPDIRSSRIREAIRRGERPSGLTLDRILDYIDAEGLYRQRPGRLTGD
jgi:nicotinate-nucleotide adenylyltransferase